MKDAGKLKNAYMAGIADTLGAEAMAEAGAMENAKLAGKLGMNLGDMASVVYDLDQNKRVLINDGDPNLYAKQGRDMVVIDTYGSYAEPIYMGGRNAQQEEYLQPKTRMDVQKGLDRMRADGVL